MLVPGDSGESSGEMGVIWQHRTPVRLPSVGWGTVGREMAFCAHGRSAAQAGWHQSLRTCVKPATHFHRPSPPCGQVAGNPWVLQNTWLLTGVSQTSELVQMFQYHLGMSLNPKNQINFSQFFKLLLSQNLHSISVYLVHFL